MNHRHINKRFLLQLSCLILLIIFSCAVYGIGVSPSSMTLAYEPGDTRTIEFFGENRNSDDAHVRLFIAGPLENYTYLSETESVIPGSSKKRFNLRITYPESMAPGTYSSSLYIEEITPPEEFLKTGAAFGAKGAVIMHINVKVPYTGRYLEVKFPPMGSVMPGQMLFFTLNAYNYGGESIKDISSIFTILSPDSSEYAHISTTKIETLNPMDAGELRGYWQVPIDAAHGKYIISAMVDYDGDKPAADKQHFRIGDEFIDITGIKSLNIKPNNIGKFLIDIKSEWGQEIPDVYADVVILYDSNTVEVIRTSSLAVPAFAKESLTAYWEIGEKIEAEYEARIILYFGDKTVEKMISFGPQKEAKLERPVYPEGSAFIFWIVSAAILTIVILACVVLLTRLAGRPKKTVKKVRRARRK